MAIILAHKRLVKKDILHRDLSPYNIMLAETHSSTSHHSLKRRAFRRGLLIDLDCATLMKDMKVPMRAGQARVCSLHLNYCPSGLIDLSPGHHSLCCIQNPARQRGKGYSA